MKLELYLLNYDGVIGLVNGPADSVLNLFIEISKLSEHSGCVRKG